MFHRGSDFHDLLALNQHLAGFDDFSSFNVEQASRMQHDRMRHRCRGLSNQVQAEQEWNESDQEPRVLDHMGRDGNTPN